jgi:2-polyprenyl-3-methyl-5-hydroxy-6-metoxy-1,4-benzoquinol methylase
MIREKIILSTIKDKKVLDIGSIGQTNDYNLWNLYFTVPFKELTGIDLPDSKQSLQDVFKINKVDTQRPSNIVFGNMENYKFNEKFDVIVAGDVIEHVSNQGLFLQNIREHLNENGQLIITTPNAKWLTVIFKPNPTHTLWHDRYTLEYILKQNGFQIELFKYYFGNKNHYNWISRILTLRQSMIFICSKI